MNGDQIGIISQERSRSPEENPINSPSNSSSILFFIIDHILQYCGYSSSSYQLSRYFYYFCCFYTFLPTDCYLFLTYYFLVCSVSAFVDFYFFYNGFSQGFDFVVFGYFLSVLLSPCQLSVESKKRGACLWRLIIRWANFSIDIDVDYSNNVNKYFQLRFAIYIIIHAISKFTNPLCQFQQVIIIILFMQNQHDQINDGYCECSICTQAPILKTIQPQKSTTIEPIVKNCLPFFLQLFPRNFPLCITPTVCPKLKMFFFNRQTNRLTGIPFTKITDHFPLATNVVLFYPNKSSIAHKYELIKQDNNFTYVQIYTPIIPFIVYYNKDENFMDQVLQQKIVSLVKNIAKDENYDWTPAEKDFLLWVHKDYQDTVFCKYMTKIYCDFIEKTRKDKIISAKFQWVIQKPGLIRLFNVKNLIIQRNKKSATFQQEYQQKILEKLNMKNPNASLQINLFNAFVKPSKINHRINHFKNEIRQIFHNQKLKILKKTQKQRTVESNTLSDDVARLFLPQLHKYSSLREVLCDQTKFKKVVLGIDDSKNKKPEKPFKRVVRPSQGITVKKTIHQRHYRSKTEM